MVTRFRDAFIDALRSPGQNLAAVARGSGVSESHLQALHQCPETQTSVDDAKKIAAHFGADLDTFLGNPELKGPLGIVALYSQLPDHVKRQFQAYGPGPSEPPDPTEPE